MKKKKLLEYHEQLHRQKSLVRSDPMKWFKGGSDNKTVIQTAGLMSTSFDPNHRHHKPENPHPSNLIIQNYPAFYPCIDVFSNHTPESEVVIPSGSQFVIKKNGGRYELTLVNTPMSVFPFSYKIAKLLRTLATSEYCKPYVEPNEAGSLLLNGKRIYRPNHGIPHAIRQLFYVDPIIEYFKEYAEPKALANFCRTISDELRETIKLALCFAAIGRKSELNFAEDPELYFTYRQCAAELFARHTSTMLTNSVLTRFKRLVLYMGNPKFPTTINVPGKADYNEEDNFIFHIMTLAHKLDLPRCYSPTKYSEALTPYFFASRRNLEPLMFYAMECIVATGDQLMHGYAIRAQSYELRFAEASASPRICEEFLLTIPSPCWAPFLTSRVTAVSMFTPKNAVPAKNNVPPAHVAWKPFG